MSAGLSIRDVTCITHPEPRGERMATLRATEAGGRVDTGNREGAMAWYAKFDGVDGSAKATDGTSNTLMLTDMDSLKFMPEKEDEVLVAFEFGDMDRNVDGRDFLVWQRNTGSEAGDPEDLAWSAPTSPGPHAGAYGFFLTKQPAPIDALDMVALGDDADKPSLVVKFDIGGPPGSVIE